MLSNKKTSKMALYVIIVITLIFSLCYYISALGDNYPITMVNARTAQLRNDFGGSGDVLDTKICDLANVECDGYVKAKITAFSSGECHTAWCRNNPDRIGHQVALNKKFGRVSKIYIPAYNKTYDVIGTTDSKTDLDIYFGKNYQGAKKYGVKYLKIKLIK